jgi:hypothetical protein
MAHFYITFSGEQYHETTGRIVRDGPKLAAMACGRPATVLVYDDIWLRRCRPEFMELNRWLWEHHGDRGNHKRGFGWFAWKPLIILDAMERASAGDVILFTDADTYPIADLSPLFRICRRQGGQILFAASGVKHQQYCKRDQFIVMGQDEPRYTGPDVQAGVARFMLFQKGPWKIRQFLMEWLTYCVNPLAQTFDPSVLAREYADADGRTILREPRCEQAIMTNLAHRYGWPLHREACQFGDEFPEDRDGADAYPTVFHQKGDHAWGAVRGNGSMFRNVED